MADSYIAQGMIRWGPKDKITEVVKNGGNPKDAVVVFYDGDVVTGPDEDEMKELLEAGAVVKRSDLERRQAPEGASDMEEGLRKAIAERDEKIAQLQARVAELEGASKSSSSGGAGSTSSSSSGSKSTTK